MSEWFYVLEGKQEGPVSEDELKSKLDSGLLNESVTVWKEGLTDWLPISERNAIKEDVTETELQPATPLKGLANLQLLSIVACVVCLINPFAAFAFVYSLQAKNAHQDGRDEDAKKKMTLCKTMLIIAFILSTLVYAGVSFMYLSEPLVR